MAHDVACAIRFLAGQHRHRAEDGGVIQHGHDFRIDETAELRLKLAATRGNLGF